MLGLRGAEGWGSAAYEHSNTQPACPPYTACQPAPHSRVPAACPCPCLLPAPAGGQKSRVAMARVTFSKPHILLLDEPSNHLDMDAVEALVEVG